MEEKEKRSEKLGFVPQKENIYNNLLPYAEKLDEESQRFLNDIKINISKAILCQSLNDIVFWTHNMSRYLKLYGHKFSKEDHIYFIKVWYELIMIPDIELEFIKSACSLLQALLKKAYLLSREDLVLPWRPFYELYQKIFDSSYESFGMILIPYNFENIFKNLTRICSTYFPVESTQEILDELRPLMCLFDTEMSTAINYFEYLLCTSLPPNQHDQGFKLWFDELMEMWESWHNIPNWESTLIHLLARLAKDNIGYIDWEPHIPKIFTGLLRSFNLPGRANSIQVVRAMATYDTTSITTLLVSILGKNSSCQLYLSRMFKSLESFYHPSNHGRWAIKMHKFLHKLPYAFVKRLHREKHIKLSWQTPVPETAKLTNAEITDFVNSILPSALLAMFSKRGCTDASVAFQTLGSLRPEIVIPPLIERVYSSLETLTEPHRLTAVMQCMIPICRHLVQKNKFFPEGPKHVIPILMSALPGIDPNDIKKCMFTCQLISIMCNLLLIIDCSSIINTNNELSQEMQQICADTALFEDFVLQFMDRIFVLIENSCMENPSRLDRDSERTNPEENFLEMGIYSTFAIIMMQSSPPIFQTALKKLQTFITSHIFEINLSGKYAAHTCRVVCRINPQLGLETFMPHFTRLVFALTEHDEILEEETLDDELLFSLLILSEIVRCDGAYLVKYQNDIVKILQKSLKLKCKKGYLLGSAMFKQTLKSYLTLYPKESFSIPNPWDRHGPDHLHRYIEDWGVPGNIHNLDLKFHIPNPEEVAAAKELIEKFLVAELDVLQSWVHEQISLSREEILRSLTIIHDGLVSAAFSFPMWEEEQFLVKDSSMPPYQSIILESCSESLDIQGKNARQYVCNVMRQVLEHINKCHEDDTQSLFKAIQIYKILLFRHGLEKEEYDSRMKSFRVVKNYLGDTLCTEKKHMRSLLIDRILLQHDFRTTEKFRCYFTQTHVDILQDLMKISTSHYSEVRKRAQQVLHFAIGYFSACYKVVVPQIMELLKKDPIEFHEEFKGVLHVITGQKTQNFIRIRNWEIISNLWPAIVSSQHSEKPSIIKLLESISVYIQKHFPTNQITFSVPENCLHVAENYLKSNDFATFTSDEFTYFKNEASSRSERNKRNFYLLVDRLVDLIENGNLHWRHNHLALTMLAILVRYDVLFPRKAVKVFVTRLIHDTLAVRKLALHGTLCVMKQHKRKHPKIIIDPTKQNRSNVALHPFLPKVENMPDNFWLQYNSLDPPDTEEKWNSRHFVHKTHWGFNCWPKKFYVHAPDSQQPNIDRTYDELPDEEKPIYESFSEESFISTLLSFLSLEEKKDHDKFDTKKFYLFKRLFDYYGDTFLPHFNVHLQKMVVDKQESVQRCAAEIIAGIMTGSKHWNFQKMQNLKNTMTPIFENVLKCLTPETLSDWVSCISCISESRDPNKYYWVFELFMKEPQSIENGSFIESSWLYLLLILISQQEWRVCELLHRILNYIHTKLDHSYQNVREKLGSFIVSIFSYDLPVNAKSLAYTPKLVPFLDSVLPILSVLESDTNGESMLACSSEETPEKKSAKNTFRTICRWISLTGSKTLRIAPPPIFQLLPLICQMVNDTSDEGFQRECRISSAILSQAYLDSESINSALKTLQDIACNRSWHSRVSGAGFLQHMVFSNLFIIMHNEEWVREIKDLVMKSIEDERVEVRESGGETLCGFLHCEFFKIDEKLLHTFKSKIKKRLRTKQQGNNEPKTFEVEEIRERHSGILGLCACVNAYPYDVPEFLPDILVLLGDHLNDPQPISGTIKKTLSSFRRTHYDNWRDHKLKFTDDQLAVITDLLISPCYYA